jgi:hypothetical protein
MNVQQKSTKGVISSNLQDTEDTRLHGRWLMLARFCGSLWLRKPARVEEDTSNEII